MNDNVPKDGDQDCTSQDVPARGDRLAFGLPA